MVEKGNENKFLQGKIIIYTLCAAGVLILLMICIFSFGWFTNSKSSRGNVNGLRAVDSDFELGAVDSSGKYDEYLTAEDGRKLIGVNTESLLKTIDPVSTGNGRDEIKWVMSSDSNFNNYSGEDSPDGIQPGSSGRLSFYVIAKRDTDLNITFSLDTILYDSNAKPINESNTDNSACIIPETQPEAKLADGHILFFKEYDDNNKIYSHRINGKTFNFSKPQAKADTAYRVDIYWIWPEVIDQLILPANDSRFNGREYRKIISDEDTAALKSEMISSYAEYFADENTILQEMLENVSKGSADADFSIEYYNKLNAKWNEADQLIGRQVGYLELQVAAVDT